MRRLFGFLTVLVLAASEAGAQTVRQHLELGDQAAARLDPAAALEHYRQAIAGDSANVHALNSASATAVELGEYEASSSKRSLLYAEAERLAKRAVAVAPRNAEAHFALARALGRTALSVGSRERIRYATDIREHALMALAIDSTHAGALHVMGVWNAEVMRLNGMARMIARNFLGGQVFGSASWGEAVRFMERSVAVEPDRISHRLDLAKIYLDLTDGKRRTENREKAREHLEHALAVPPATYNDRHYLSEAEALLRRL
jgi:tetratricopeptide (TPR) repeat protein